MIDLDELEAKASGDEHVVWLASSTVLDLVHRLRETEDALLKATTMNIRDMNTVSEYNALYHREADKNQKFEAIVHDLAASHVIVGAGYCVFCERNPDRHEESCPYRRAVEAKP